MSGAGEDGSRQQERRYRSDLQGVLQFASDVQNSATSSHEPPPLSAERREFLNAALSSMTVDIVGEIKKALHLLQDKEVDDETKIAAIEHLSEVCEDINAACDFQKIGGFPVLQSHLRHSNPQIRWLSADLFAGLVQNNEYCQKAATNVRLMKLLMDLMDQDEVDMVRIKALYALSCLCRDCVEAQNEFCRLDGFSFLMRAMQRHCDKLQVKAVFMLRSLCLSQPRFKDTLCDMGMTEQLIALLHHPHTEFHEHVMSALVTVTDGHTRAISACQQPELEFDKLLRDRIKEIDGKDEFEEEKQYAEQLLSLCFNTRPASLER